MRVSHGQATSSARRSPTAQSPAQWTLCQSIPRRSPIAIQSPIITMPQNPDNVALNANLAHTVAAFSEADRLGNMGKTQDPKAEDFFQFCNLVYTWQRNRCILLQEKVHSFMFYQAFWEKKKKSGGDKAALAHGECFDLEEYCDMIKHYNGIPIAGLTLIPNPVKPISPATTFNLYKAVTKKIYKLQKFEKQLGLHWDDIWTLELEALQKHVKERQPKIKKAMYQEKIDGAFSLYLVVEWYSDIEDAFWNDSMKTNNNKSISSRLHHCFCMTMTTSGILWCESIYHVDLSDLCGLYIPSKETDVHPMFCMVMQISQGKTNHGCILYGRAMQHKDIQLCAVGSLSFYLM
jgi:hypothetical protein